MNKGQSTFYLYLLFTCTKLSGAPFPPSGGQMVRSGGRRHQNEDTKVNTRSCYHEHGASLCTELAPSSLPRGL